MIWQALAPLVCNAKAASFGNGIPLPSCYGQIDIFIAEEGAFIIADQATQEKSSPAAVQGCMRVQMPMAALLNMGQLALLTCKACLPTLLLVSAAICKSGAHRL